MIDKSEKLLESYIKEIMDPHSFAPSREFEPTHKISKQEFIRKAKSMDKLFKDLKIDINLPTNISNKDFDPELNEIFGTIKKYFNRSKDFFTIGNRKKFGIDGTLEDGFEKFMVTIFPELMEAIMTAYVQVYVTEWKKGFYGADKFDLKKLVYNLPKRRKSQSKAFNLGYDYRIKAYKEKKSNPRAKVYTSWTKAAENFVVEEALKDYDEKASEYGGFKSFFKDVIVKDLNPIEHLRSFQFYIEQFGPLPNVILFIVQSVILIISYKLFFSSKIIELVNSWGPLAGLALSVPGTTLIKSISKLIRAKVLTIFSKDELKKQLIELELFESNLDPDIELDKLYLERYKKDNPGIVTIGGKINRDVETISKQNFGNQEDIDDLDFLSNISFDSESGLKASQNEVKALRKLIRLILS